MLFPLARLLRLASVSICLIAVVSFTLFAVNQTGSASTRQQQLVNGQEPTSANSSGSGSRSGASHKDSVRATIDDVSNALTSPFSGVTSPSSSEWLTRAIRLLLALAVYGFGLGFLARMIRVRV